MTVDERTDRELLAAHVEGDPVAFAALTRRHQDRLWGLALRTTGNREDAADALQDALVNAYRRAESYRAEASVTTWLHRIVVNACLDKHRHTASRPSVAVTDATLDAALANRDAGRPDVGDLVADTVDVERALATLPQDQRAALVLVDVLGHDIASAAAILGCPEGTVKSRCSRGRARLAPLLAPLRNHGAATSVQHPDNPDGGEQQ